MSKVVSGRRYLYRTITGRVYHVDVIKAGRLYSLCSWEVNNADFGYSYERAGYKANWKIIRGAN